jgi:hypothetical protein
MPDGQRGGRERRMLGDKVMMLMISKDGDLRRETEKSGRDRNVFKAEAKAGQPGDFLVEIGCTSTTSCRGTYQDCSGLARKR